MCLMCAMHMKKECQDFCASILRISLRILMIISKFIYVKSTGTLENKDGAIFQNIFCYCWAGKALDGHQRISVLTLGIGG